MESNTTGSQTLFFRLSELDKYIGWKLRILLAVLLFAGSLYFTIKGFSINDSEQSFNQSWTLALLMFWGCVSQILPAAKRFSDSKKNQR